jgi:hypothetical protein
MIFDELAGLPLPIYWAIGGCMAYDLITGGECLGLDEYERCRELLGIDGEAVPMHNIVPNLIADHFIVYYKDGWRAKPTRLFKLAVEEFEEIVDMYSRQVYLQNPQDRAAFVEETVKPATTGHRFVRLVEDISQLYCQYINCGAMQKNRDLMSYLAPHAIPIQTHDGFAIYSSHDGSLHWYRHPNR